MAMNRQRPWRGCPLHSTPVTPSSWQTAVLMPGKAALFVVGPRTRVLSILLLDLNEEGNFEILAAAGCILLLVMVTTAAIGMRAVGRDFMLRQ